MVNLIASPNRVLQFGYEGEDNVTQIIFNYDESWLSYGDGEFKVRVLRPGDKEAYNATDVVDNRSLMTLVMTVTDIELSRKGRGELQLVYICHDVVKKSEIYTFVVRRAIDSEVVNPPKGNIIAEVEESLVEIKDDIGDLTELTTTNKGSLVEAINEVNAKEGGGGGSITVDDELSGTSENPVQNKVVKTRFDSVDQTVAGIGGRLATAETTLTGKADKSYVDTELSGKADSSDVETALASKANTADVNSALSAKANTADMNTALALKANSADVQTALAGKASTDVATQSANGLMSAQDKSRLDAVYADYTSALTALGGWSMSKPLTDRINLLISQANEVTGASNTTLSDAVSTLIAGYGDSEEVFTDGNWGLPYTKDYIVGDIKSKWDNGESPFMGMTHLETVVVQSTGRWGGGSNTSNGRTVKTFVGCTALKKVTLPYLQGFATNGYNEGQIEGCENLEEFIIGSVGHPATVGMGATSGGYMIFRNNTAPFSIVIYADAETLSDVPAVLKNGAPWGATNATVIYKSSNTGEILR